MLVSHLHVDHYGGLPQLILDEQFNRRVAPLTIAGPVGTADRLTAALEMMFPGSSTVRRRFDVDVIELQPGERAASIQNAVVRAVEVDHGMPSNTALGLHIDVAGKAISYTGDTAWTDVLIELAADSDLFVHSYRPEGIDELVPPEDRQRANPDLVEIALRAYGWTGL